MKIKVICVFILPVALLAAGCATKEQPRAFEDLKSASKLEPQKGGAAEYMYRATGVDFRQYTGFMIPPAVIYTGEDAQFDDASDQDKQAMAKFITSEFTKVLSEGGYPVVAQPGPGIIRINFTLAGLELTRPALATLSHLAPIGLVANLGKGAINKQGSFMGSAIFAGEFYDSQSNQLIGAFVTKQYASAIDMTATLSGLDSAKAGVTHAAELFRDRLDKLHHRNQK